MVPKKLKDRERFIQPLTSLIQQDNNFFKKIKVNQLSMTHGQAAERHLETLETHNLNCFVFPNII
jgi:hypothetical protein